MRSRLHFVYVSFTLVVLGVLNLKIQEEVFQAEMERKLAHLLNEALGRGRIWRRATFAGNNIVQVLKRVQAEVQIGRE